jgi:hypothetical protein
MSTAAAQIEAVKAKLAETNEELAVVKVQLHDALEAEAYDRVMHQLRGDPAALAASAKASAKQVQAAKLVLTITQLDSELEEIIERERLAPYYEAVSLSSSSKQSKDLLTSRLALIDKARIMKAQIHLNFDEFLKATPFFMVTCASWQRWAATKLRNALSPNSPYAVAMALQFDAYDKFLLELRNRADQINSTVITTTSNQHQYQPTAAKIVALADAHTNLVQQARDAVKAADLLAASGTTVTSIPELQACDQVMYCTTLSSGHELALYGPGVPAGGAYRATGSNSAWTSCTWFGATLPGSLPKLTIPADTLLLLNGDGLLGGYTNSSHPLLKDLTYGENELVERLYAKGNNYWKVVPNDHWSPMHTQFVIEHWRAMMNEISPPTATAPADAEILCNGVGR